MTSGNPSDKHDPAINIHCSDCDAEGGWFRGDDCVERATKHWNNRPTRDGAEGTEKVVPVAGDDPSPYDWEDRLTEPASVDAAILANRAKAAPPKPAPPADGALQRAVNRLREYAATWDDRTDTSKPSLSEDIELVCRAAFFPPCAGAAEPVVCISAKQAMTIGISIAEKHKTAVLEILSLITDGKTPLRSSFEKALHGNLVWFASEIMVALQAAAPPVRGDRQLLAETIHKARYPSDRVATSFADEHGLGREYCFRIADAILSLPVQPGAGEREALKPFATFGIGDDGKDIRDGLMRDRICDWFGPSDFDAARVAFYLPVQPGAGEREADKSRRPDDCSNAVSCGWHHVRTEPEIGLYLCSTPGCPHMIRARSRQAPPSSSEDGR